jgi:amino acid transporter
MSILDVILGRPLDTAQEGEQKVGPVGGVPIFGLDALSSAAYGPEAALTILIPLGVAGLQNIIPISASIIVLLTIVYFSYRQTIAAYPAGGGSYTVAHENLGAKPGLLAAAALMIDYILTVAVGISAGVGALVSAMPTLQAYTLSICLSILILLSLINLRGVREASFVFMLPTYLFVGCLLSLTGWGGLKVLLSAGHPQAVINPVQLPAAQESVSAWILLKAFASGCTALTGVEAVSNGVQAFREPVVTSARRTLTVIIAILIVLLAGIAYLVHAYQIGATPPGQSGYQSMLSQLTKAVAGEGVFYYLTIASILIALSFSANTAFADFPRLCRAVAVDGYLPRSFTNRGRRLVYSEGIIVLTIFSGVLLWAFGGITDHLIPLYAVGAFMAFTLSQAGMVAHWKRTAPGRMSGSLFVNGLGALATLGTVGVIIVAKFREGAWVTLLLLALLLGLMTAVRRHYDRIEKELIAPASAKIQRASQLLVVIPVESWNKVSQKALGFALSLSPNVQAVHIQCDGTDELLKAWRLQVEEPARKAGAPIPELVVVQSPYRFVVQPIVDHVLALESQNLQRTIAVVIPHLVEPRWYNYFLHNQRGDLLAGLLFLKGDRRIVTINVPWYLRE